MRQTKKKLRKLRKSRKKLRGGSDFLVEYPSGIVRNGQIMTKQETISPPRISFKNTPTKLYTIMMWDPDAHAKPSWIHWIVTNIYTPEEIPENTILEYQGPNPPSGIHIYFIGLFEQQSGKIEQLAPTKRGGFDYSEIIKKYNLKKVSEIYFMCKNS